MLPYLGLCGIRDETQVWGGGHVRKVFCQQNYSLNPNHFSLWEVLLLVSLT